ncbi:Bug family tripartite tricarboxylate transporter substrate binding protein [Acidovorax sp. SDU_ACID1]|uniref:Bug family tripartite tricarboxylate transporter substrate binding protein n=1 Tax=Acidovorax sp. SDU_ACID1 TaxID=3136632 RepID=UPI003872CBB8
MTHRTTFTRRAAWAAISGVALIPGMAFAQQAPAAWPQKPIRLVVGFSAGGATDVVARIIAPKLGEQLGQPVVVDNRAGANGNVGAEIVARAPADGYTLYVFTIGNTINASLYAKLGYDPAKDFEPIGLIAKITNVLVVNPNLPIKSLDDYVRYAKVSKDGITFASSGSGSSIHLSGEMFKMRSGLNMLHVPYRGSAPAVTDLLGGQVDSMFDNIPSALPHVRAGKLRAIAVTSARRSTLLPDVPTLGELGYPNFDVQGWFSLVAPKGTPRAVVDQLNAALNKALASADVRQRLEENAATPESSTPEQLQALTLSEIKTWREVVKASGAQAQ